MPQCSKTPSVILLLILLPLLAPFSFDSETQSSAQHGERCLSVASHLAHLGKSAVELSYNVEIIPFLSDLP